MKITVLFLTILPFLLPTNAGPASTSQLEVGALYTMNNAPTGNFIFSTGIGLDGKLTLGKAFSAQGSGGFPQVFGGDPLGSQGSMLVSGNRLYAVNAGSNTLATFSINVLSPTEITMIGKPVNTGGDFPVSVAVFPRTGQVCVLNAGTVDPTSVNGVNCYKPDPIKGLIEIPGTNRPLNQTIIFTPLGLFNGPSEVAFSEDGTVLYAVVKGAPPTEPGFIAAWGVNTHTGALSQNVTKSFTPLTGGLPFSMTSIPGTTGFIVSDVVNGFDIFDFPTPSSVATSTGFQIQGQVATCWSRRSPKTGNFYLADFGTGNITEVHVDKNLHPTIIKQYAQGITSAIDEEIIGTVLGKDYLYVLDGGIHKITVLSLEAAGVAPQIQQLDFSPLAQNGIVLDGNFTQGLAIYNP